MHKKLAKLYDNLIIVQGDLFALLEEKYEEEGNEVFDLLEDVLGKLEPIIYKERGQA